jgi:phage-related protein
MRFRAAVFHPAARRTIKNFPDGVRKELGKAIFDLQRGSRLGMPLVRSMSAVAPGVEELRIRDESGAYRTFYFKKSRRGILILHAFVKKTQKTPLRELDIARARLKEMLDEEKN